MWYFLQWAKQSNDYKQWVLSLTFLSACVVAVKVKLQG